MKPGSWLALVVLAGVIGFLLGRGGPERERREVVRGPSGGEVRGGQPSKVGDRADRRSERSGRSFSARGESAEAFVERMLAIYMTNDGGDPFGVGGFQGMDWDRTVAAIFSLPETAFPAVLEHAKRPKGAPDDPFADPFDGGWDGSALDAMLARWADLDPRAAMAWVRAEESRDGGSMEYFKESLCRETLYSDPQLALRYIRETVAEQNSPEILAAPEDFLDFDPFSPTSDREESFETVGADKFFGVLCREHPELAVQAFAEAGTALQFDGQEGWVQGMVAAGLADQALEFAAGLEGDVAEELQESIAAELMEHDPVRVEAWLEGRPGEDYAYLQHQVMNAKFTEDPEGAAEWYLSRSAGPVDRTSRLADLAQQQGSLLKARAWLERMESAGEDTGPAWSGLVMKADPKDAWPLMDRVPEYDRKTVEQAFFKKAAEEVYVRFGSMSESLLEPKAEQVALLSKHGREEAFEAYIRDHNAKVASQALAFLQKQGLVELEE